jgi:CRP-like cAMP-binding protein
VALTTGQVLSEPGERIRYVYFPTRSVVSLIAKATGDATLEVALVGADGMVGLPLMLGANTKPLLALVQRSGEAWRMKAESFIRMTDSNRTLRRALSKYAFVRLGACLDFCVLRHSMSTRKDMYATQEHEEIDCPSIGATA